MLNSGFTKAIRRAQPRRESYLTPCVLIDEPDVLREAVTKCHAYPTHPGAEPLLTDLTDDIDACARSYRDVADDSWETEYREKSSRRKGQVRAVRSVTTGGLH